MEPEIKKTERKILGICAWLADKFEFDVTTLRLIFVIATLIGVGSPVILYLILYFVKPSGY